MTNQSAITTHDQFQTALAQAQTAAAAYYDTDTLVMTDQDYDTLTAALETAITEHPDWDADGVLNQVAAGVSAGGTVTHPEPMLSLAKTTEPDELAAFLTRIDGRATVTEPKLDGMAVRAVYTAGTLTLVATRGDGTTGEDVTAQARTITGLPATLPTPVDLEVRGEVYMTDTDFDTATTNRVAAGKNPFVNPRNATAGTLRNADLTYDAPLSFAAYDATGPAVDTHATYTARMNALREYGITTTMTLIADLDPAGNPATVIATIRERRATLGFPIDGAVIKVDTLTDRTILGADSRTPRWATAWKYPAAEARSVLRGIDVAVGRTGRLSYTGLIDPVFVGGATISRASLHHAGWLTEQGLGIGSVVAVIRAGDVIPRITTAIGEQPNNITPYIPADDCPQCGEPLDKTSLLWRCHTPSCSTVGKIVFFGSRDVMDVDGLGDEVATALIEAGLVNDIADLYTLTAGQVADVPLGATSTGSVRRIGMATATKLIAGIDASKTQPFNRVVCSLGIRMTGRSVSRWLASEFKTMDALRAATVDQVAAIDKLGTVKATFIVDGLAAMGPVIDRLAAAGVTMGVPATDTATAAPLSGMTVVVTGAMTGPLASKSRNEMNELIEANGGKASGSVSARTSLLVCGEPGSSKYVKAEQLGIRIVTPEEFAALIAG